MELSVTKLFLILIIVLVVFGAGKLPRVMNDIGKGVRSLKEGLKGEDSAPQEPKKIADDKKDGNA